MLEITTQELKERIAMDYATFEKVAFKIAELAANCEKIPSNLRQDYNILSITLKLNRKTYLERVNG